MVSLDRDYRVDFGPRASRLIHPNAQTLLGIRGSLRPSLPRQMQHFSEDAPQRPFRGIQGRLLGKCRK